MDKIVFRVDSGFHMGVGHVARCLSLAHELKNDFHIHFISKNHPGANLEIIKKDFTLHLIPGQLDHALTEDERLDYANWLGSSQEQDLIETNKILQDLANVKILVIDHYSIDEQFEKGVRAPFIFVIDDLMNRHHCCDLLLDQNISAVENTYRSLTALRCKSFLIGPTYALLRSEFSEARRLIDKDSFDRKIEKILVFFGAADVNNDTLKFIQMALPLIGERFKVSLFLSEQHRDFYKCKEMIEEFSNCSLTNLTSDFIQHVKVTDLFIGAGGTASYEKACLGVASALMVVAPNQKLACEKLSMEKIGYLLGNSGEMTLEKWSYFFNEIVPNRQLWLELRTNSYALVDGLGTLKVAKVIKSLVHG